MQHIYNIYNYFYTSPVCLEEEKLELAGLFPLEILKNIFGCLHDLKLFKMERVCRSWRLLIMSTEIWQEREHYKRVAAVNVVGFKNLYKQAYLLEKNCRQKNFV